MMDLALAQIETRRLALQDALDGQRDSSVRNRMGQFATPTELAVDIQRYAKTHLQQSEKVRFLDPAIGTGAFYSALLGVFPQGQIGSAVGFEIDPHYGEPAERLWGETGLDTRIEDFTRAEAPGYSERFNLLICNPPYVRHHHIANGNKRRLKERTHAVCEMEVSGLAGLYCYFLGLSHEWMAEDGLAGWLIPSEFMDVNYGASVKRYLLEKVTLLHIHRFDPNDVQFGDALVSSAVVWFRNTPPPVANSVRFTFGGTLVQPNVERFVSSDCLLRDRKWTRYPAKQAHEATIGPVLGNFFKIKRGLVTGDNSYFILPQNDIKKRGLPMDAFKPILPNPRYLIDDEIGCDCDGFPLLDRQLFLLDPPWTEDEIRGQHPKLWMYLEQGRAKGVANRYTCRHRALWYTQECRPPAPFVCTYLGRNDKKHGNPFRFILNNSNATAANVYLMLYPNEPFSCLLESLEMKRRVWEYLNQICPQVMLGEGRVYGGGLYKLEPKELGNVPAESLLELFPEFQWQSFGN